ncbi:hypothetical protein Tco_0873291 [Tanacetum coccineum]
MAWCGGGVVTRLNSLVGVAACGMVDRCGEEGDGLLLPAVVASKMVEWRVAIGGEASVCGVVNGVMKECVVEMMMFGGSVVEQDI